MEVSGADLIAGSTDVTTLLTTAQNHFRHLVPVLEAAAKNVQLLTLHVVEAGDDSSMTVFAASLGGDEMGQARVEDSNTIALVIAQLTAVLSLWARRFMSADGRLVEDADQKNSLRDWLAWPAEFGVLPADQMLADR